MPAHLRWIVAGLAAALAPTAPALAADKDDVAQFVEVHVLPALGLAPDLSQIGLWTSESSLPGLDARAPELPTLLVHPDEGAPDWLLPFPRTWPVMIDAQPGANFRHSVYIVSIEEDEAGNLVGFDPAIVHALEPPALVAEQGFGAELPFACHASARLGLECSDLAVPEPPPPPPAPAEPQAAPPPGPCLRAVIIAGCGRPSTNHARYAANVKSMYSTLIGLGVPPANIVVCYAGGGALIVGGSNIVNMSCANKQAVRNQVKAMAAAGDPAKDVLLVYTTGHGIRKAPDSCGNEFEGLMLWRTSKVKLGQQHVYTVGEFGDDINGAKAKRVVLVADQCFSGAFVNVAASPGVPTCIFAAAKSDCVSWGRQYMEKWEAENAAATTLLKMHPVSLAGGTNDDKCPCSGGPGATVFVETPLGAANFRLSTCFGPDVAANDSCGAAMAVGDGDHAFDTNGALTDAPSHAGCASGQTTFDSDLWYSYTSTCTGTLTASTCNSGFDTILAVYGGPPCVNDASTLRKCNDDGCGKQSSVKLCVNSGEKLLIRVAGFQNAVGSGTLKIACAAAADDIAGADCSCLSDLNGDGSVEGADLGLLLSFWSSGGSPADLDGDGTVGPADLGALLSAWGDCGGEE